MRASTDHDAKDANSGDIIDSHKIRGTLTDWQENFFSQDYFEALGENCGFF